MVFRGAKRPISTFHNHPQARRLASGYGFCPKSGHCNSAREDNKPKANTPWLIPTVGPVCIP